MFSKAALKLLKRSVKAVNIWAVLPISWDDGSSRVVLRTSKWRKFLWFVNFLFHVTHWLFVLTRYIELRVLNPTSAKGSMKVYTEYVVIAYSLPLILHGTTYWRFQELVNFINEHMHFHRVIKAITDKEGGVKIGKDCDRLLRFMWRSGYLICWLNLAVGFRRPNRPVLLSSLVADPTGLKIWQRILLLIPHVYVWWTMWSVMHLLALHIVASVHVISSTAAYLKNMAKVGGPGEGIKFAHLFRALQILRIKQGAALGPPISAHQLPFVLMIIRSIYGALKGEGLVRVLQGVIGLCAWLYLQLAFRALGSIHETSHQALRIGKRMNGNSWFRKFLRSCKPLKVTVGGLYYVDKGMPLTLAGIILESTVNLLIAEK